jgi:ketosteroid isomerase-like protein
MRTRLIIALGLVLFMAVSCEKKNDTAKEDAGKAMLSMMHSYIDAIRELSYEKTVAHFLNSPDFFFCSDGQVSTYDDLLKQVRDLYSNLQRYQGDWDTINIRVLSPDVVAALAPFHEIYTDKSGVETRIKGEVTWVAVRKNGEWKFAYAHAFSKTDAIP